MSEVLVLDNFTLLDGTGAAPVPEARVVVEDGVIVSVGSASPAVTGAEVLEGRGRWLLPGLWDTHMHHGFSAGGLISSDELSEEQLLLNWRGYLRSGVTSAVSTGDDPDTVLAARAAEREGTLLGPRIFAAGSVFTAPGGHPVGTILHGEAARLRGLAIEVADPADARRRLRGLVEDGIDLVKVIYSTIPGNGPRLGRDVLDALIEEGHRLGRPVVAHVSTSEEAAECVAAGVDGLEHMVLDDGEVLDHVLAACRERQVFWTPTLSLFDRMAHQSDPMTYVESIRPEGFVSRTVLRSVSEWAARIPSPAPGTPVPPWERTVELAGRAHAAGVRLALGTDAGMTAVFHGLAVHRELELLVRAGLTPNEALTAATAVAAAKVRADGRLGTVEAGKEADLLILRHSPFDDIRNTREIDLVIKRGSLFQPANLTVD